MTTVGFRAKSATLIVAGVLAFGAGAAEAQYVPSQRLSTSQGQAIAPAAGGQLSVQPMLKLMDVPKGFSDKKVTLTAPTVAPLIAPGAAPTANAQPAPVPPAIAQAASAMLQKLSKPAGSDSASSTGSARGPALASIGSAIGAATASSGQSSIGSATGTGSGIGANNFGNGKFNTVYHFTDLNDFDVSHYQNYPQSTIGYFLFTFDNSNWFYCTASMISKSIAVAAGHCVHDQAQPGSSSGWIKQGIFVPGCINCHDGYFSNNFYAPFNLASAAAVVTTYGWYNIAQLDQGYDISLIVLNKRNGTSNEMGTYTGTLGFCYSGCLWNNNYLTQAGYPRNLANGDWIFYGQHLSISDGADYQSGTAATGGSSGGPYIANIGTVYNSDSDQGQFATRNIVFATNSWKYNDNSLKIAGASSLSGPSDSNQFKAMFNIACSYAQSLHGSGSCSMLP